MRVDLLVRPYVIYCYNAWDGRLSSVFYVHGKDHYGLFKYKKIKIQQMDKKVIFIEVTKLIQHIGH